MRAPAAVAPATSASDAARGMASAPLPAPPAPATEQPDEPHHGDDNDEIDDDLAAGDLGHPSPAPDSPLLELSDAELVTRYRRDKTSLGPISVGSPAMGLLVAGAPMPPGEAWELSDPHAAYGTDETIAALRHAAEVVHAAFPKAHPIVIGHISARTGGPLSPHKSHQSGRDVDIGFYHTGAPPHGLKAATAHNVEVAPTWLFLKTILHTAAVEYVFVDARVQRLLLEHAVATGEDAAFLDEVFLSRNKNPRAPIRHLHGHHNHFHIRFYSPNAVALGQRLAKVLPRPAPRKPGPPTKAPVAYTEIRARSGDTLQAWAKRFHTTVEELRALNGLSGNALKIGHTYKVPKPTK